MSVPAMHALGLYSVPASSIAWQFNQLCSPSACNAREAVVAGCPECLGEEAIAARQSGSRMCLVKLRLGRR